MKPSSASIDFIAAPKISFASQQNAVALIKELRVENTSEESLENLVLTLISSPNVILERTWSIQLIKPGCSTIITDRKVDLDAGLLFDLTEGIQVELKFDLVRVNAEDSTERGIISSATSDLEVLPKNHWGGSGCMIELLPAYSVPNDPACDQILKSACNILKKAGRNPSINGYEDNSRSRSWELCSAIWTAVCNLGLDYSLPPASFEEEGQKIRSVANIVKDGLATCLETTLLFTSVLEQARLHPLIILTKGHAFAGVWLQPEKFNQLTVEDAMTIRKRVELNDILVFETTLATNHPPATFNSAIAKANEQLEDDGSFHVCIDIQRARMQKISPLASEGEKITNMKGAVVESIDNPFEAPPRLPSWGNSTPEVEDENIDRVTLWQRRLLDLTARNRLLNLPERSKHIPIVCPNIGKLEDYLSSGKKFRINHLPDMEKGGRDSELYNQVANEDLIKEFTDEALDNNQIYSSLSEKRLENSLIDLFRKAKSDIAEGGANTLFLALGFLHWKRSLDDTRVFRAPLILLPVTLNRRSARSGVTLSLHEDETRFNMTLLEMLKQDYDLTIPGLSGDLPEDEHGVDVVGIWNHIRQHIKEEPGFEVKEECALATFSFSKYLMWKDLVDRQDELMVNPVVEQLLTRGEDGYTSEHRFPEPEELDEMVDPSELFTPLPADSSQLAAVLASTCHCNFILDGPPGTGKSQTIANMIVHNLARGKRVLFVAEKMAALDVVHRRLEAIGLGQFCLEVHSNKTSKQSILSQLDKAWSSRGDISAEEWETSTSRLRSIRDHLNEVCKLLHHRHENGITVHFALGQVIRHHSPSMPILTWKNQQHTKKQFAKLKDIVNRLSLHADTPRNTPPSFQSIHKEDWSLSWQEELIGSTSLLPSQIAKLQPKLNELSNLSSIKLEPASLEEAKVFANLITAILKSYGYNLSFVFDPTLKGVKDKAKNFKELLKKYAELKGSLSVSYSDKTVESIAADSFKAQWQEAQQKMILVKWLAMRKVKKTFMLAAGTAQQPDIEKDPDILKDLQNVLNEIQTSAKSLITLPGFDHLNSDPELIDKSISIAQELQAAITRCASTPESLQQMKSAAQNLVTDANELLSPEGSLATAFSSCSSAIDEHQESLSRFSNIISPDKNQALSFKDTIELCETIGSHSQQLKQWSIWKAVRSEAMSCQLAPLVKGIENATLLPESIEHSFLTAYCKWFATIQIDKNEALRTFSAIEHSDSIENFRKIDERVANLTVEYTKAMLTHRLPARSKVGKKDGYGILKRELEKKRMHKPLRQLADEMGDAFSNLAPCMLMSPLSIAQYLPAGQKLFDLVIFDEASQITPWDAVGSIARGKQVVIAGDPRQMPPTNFFQRGVTQNDLDDDIEMDLESILDECRAVGVPQQSLTWHYRSKNESLITFSNHRYYDGKLITFPAPITKDTAVSWKYVKGIYAKGSGRTNQAEAEAIVAQVVESLKTNITEDSIKSLGVITLNTEQQKLIEDLLDKARKDHPEIEPYFAENQAEPVVVKNLETVQGDERDIILLSIAYGPTELGAQTMSMNFGPLNRDGGERRLNVAITRAREEMVVFSSFPSSMIDLNRTGARAVRDLKHFLEFADKGPHAMGAAVEGSMGSYDSPFEEAVANRLREKGWEVVPQIGVSRFRIDLGIVHPDHPGDYLVGVECDGATYHSSATARDRDKVRQSVLEGLGWELVRVWSTDWFIDPLGETEKLHKKLEEALEVNRKEYTERAKSRELEAEVDRKPLSNTTHLTEAQDPSKFAKEVDEKEALPLENSQQAVEMKAKEGNVVSMIEANLEELAAQCNPEQFYLTEYEHQLTKIIEEILNYEAPIAEDLLVKKVARSHGFNRSGRKIKERVLSIVDKRFFSAEDQLKRAFVWKDDSSQESYNHFRKSKDGRKFDEVSYAEIKALFIASGEPPSVDLIATNLGIKRITANLKEQMEQAIALYNNPHA